jgi:nucleoside-diphosphate-sugar epimerase
MRRLLAIGLSGPVGDAVREGLQARGDTVVAVSRKHREDAPGLSWRHGSLESMPDLDEAFDAILSLGPLDAFVRWYVDALPSAPRVIALSSTGRHDKRMSEDPRERELAARLAAAEAGLFAAGRTAGATVTVLRPSLMYGRGRDQNLSVLVATARRWGVLPMPWNATGLRQPVHVDDVAAAVLACLDESLATSGKAFDLPGRETMSFEAMVRRTLAVHAPGARLLKLPPFVFALASSLVELSGRPAPGRGTRVRVALDQLADPGPARNAFGYDPGRFRP